MMERLTTDNPQTNTETMLNLAYAKNGWVVIRHLVENEWISVKDRLPVNETPVLIAIEKHYQKWEQKTEKYEERIFRTVVKAFHTDGKLNTENSEFCWNGDDTNWKYVEAEDAYIIPEGWWEYPYYAEEFAAVSDFVTHWMPLPELPKVQKHG